MASALSSPRRPPRPRTRPQKRKRSEALPPRITVAFWLAVAALVLVLGVESRDTPDGWSALMMIPAVLLEGAAVWLMHVELRDPWWRR